MTTPKAKVYLVGDTGRDGHIHAVFTDKRLAEEFAQAAGENVEEWDANIPKEEWCYGGARLWAKKKNGKWEIDSILLNEQMGGMNIGPASVDCQLGHYSAWGNVPDPVTGEFTDGYANINCHTAGQAKDMIVAEFWKKVAELDPNSLTENKS